jgi:hypothetical protein
MPMEYLVNLEVIILMQPTFSQRASRFFSFGVIPNYINDHIKYADSLQQMCELININKQKAAEFLPKVVKRYYAP